MKLKITNIYKGKKTKWKITRDNLGYNLSKRGFLHWKYVRHYSLLADAIEQALEG